MSADAIDTLPTDKTPPTHEEAVVANVLFKEQLTTTQKILAGTKDVLIISALYILFSVPQVDELIKKFFPTTVNSPYQLLLGKAVLFGFVYFLIKNFYLVRK